MSTAECVPDLWIDVYDFMAHTGVSDHAIAAQAVEEASWILFSLTNTRFSANAQKHRDMYRYRPGVQRFRLYHGPVDEVYSVGILDIATGVTTPADYLYLYGGVVRLGSQSNASGCSLPDRLVVVEYLTRPNVPAGGVRAATKLAKELYSSYEGGPCALPDRVTSVSRQGLAWVLLDPMDFLGKGLTGVGSVDQWISAMVRQGGAGAIDPLEWLELVETEVYGCADTVGP